MTRWLYASLVLTAAAGLAWGYLCFVTPDIMAEKVPIHWNFEMKPDAWRDRDQVWPILMIFPAVMLGMVLLTIAIPWLSPKNFKVDSFKNTFHYVMFLVVVLMGYLGLLNVWALPGHTMPVSGFFGAIFLFFALIGSAMGKVKRNFWMGVRTPWTLASETVWNRTHRLSAWLWTIAGGLGFIGVLAGVPWWLCFAILMLAVLFPVAYSLVLYKKLEREGKLEGTNT